MVLTGGNGTVHGAHYKVEQAHMQDILWYFLSVRKTNIRTNLMPEKIHVIMIFDGNDNSIGTNK